jgi:hypothetical protein
LVANVRVYAGLFDAASQASWRHRFVGYAVEKAKPSRTEFGDFGLVDGAMLASTSKSSARHWKLIASAVMEKL